MQGLQKGRSQGTAAQEPVDLQQKKMQVTETRIMKTGTWGLVCAWLHE